MEMRITRMLTTSEVIEDLGISHKSLRFLKELKILNPIVLGIGDKYPQEQILEFQRKFSGYDISTYAKARIALEEIEKATAATVTKGII